MRRGDREGTLPARETRARTALPPSTTTAQTAAAPAAARWPRERATAAAVTAASGGVKSIFHVLMSHGELASVCPREEA